MSRRLILALSGLALALSACAKEEAGPAAEHESHAPAPAAGAGTETPAPVSESTDPVFEAATVKLPIGGRDVSSARLTIRAGSEPLKLVGASADFADTIELHIMTMVEDSMTMRRVEALEIPANTVLDMGQTGEHLMLFGVDATGLEEGDTVEILLDFEQEDGTISAIPVPFTVVGLD